MDITNTECNNSLATNSSCMNDPGNIPSDGLNPFLIDVIIRKLGSNFDFKTLVNARLVCKSWDRACRSLLQNRACIQLTGPYHDSSDECGCEVTCETDKCRQFQDYLNQVQEDKLASQRAGSAESSEALLLFRNYKFVCRRRSRKFSQEAVLSELGQHFPQDVQGLSFENQEDNVPRFEEQAADSRSWLPYRDWGDTLGQFSNLRALELIGLPRESTAKCLIALRKLLEGRTTTPSRLRKLIIRPRSSVEYDLTRFIHLRYIDLLARVVSLMPLEEFGLSSHLSAEELPQILRNMPRLRFLSLERFVHIAAHVQMFQATESSIFPLDLPNLKRLEIPNVYFQNIEEINRNLPNLCSLSIKYQPMMIFADTVDYPDHVEPECAAVRLDFSLIVVDRPIANESMEEVEWAVDPTGNVLSNYDIGLNDVCDITLFCISTVFPNLKKLKVFISSSEDMRMIFRRFCQLEQLVVTEDSIYSPTDEDFIGNEIGIRSMTKLQVLKLSNDNSRLTPESFRNGFSCLPELRTLIIRNAPTLSRYVMYAQKDNWNPLLQNVTVSKD